jgi:hypothetical protein
MDQDIAAPPIFDRCREVPFPSKVVFEAVQQDLWCPQGNCAASCCTIGSSVQASANNRIFETARVPSRVRKGAEISSFPLAASSQRPSSSHPGVVDFKAGLYQAQASRVHRSGFDRARGLRGATDRRRSPGEDFPRARTPPGDGLDSITARRALTLLRQPSFARPRVIPSPSPTVPSAARAGPVADTALPSGNTRRHAPGRGRWRF